MFTVIAQAVAQNPAAGLDSGLRWTGTGTPVWDTFATPTAMSGGDVARASQAGDSAMETVVAGPAVVSFSWRLLGPDGKGWMALEIDDREMAILRRAVPWQKVEINLPPGDHTLRIRALEMARVPGSAAEADGFAVDQGAHLPWLDGLGDDPEALWVVTGSGRVKAESMPNLFFDDGAVATFRETQPADRTSLVRLVQGPARLVPWVNAKGGSFVARDLDSVGNIRRVNAPSGNTWDDAPIIVGPGLHRVEWVHFYWSPMENETDPYPLTLPANVTAGPADVATLASVTVFPLTLDNTLAGGLTWTSSGTHPFVPTLADRLPNSLNPDQAAALAVERPGPGQDARLATVITGPAEVSLTVRSDGPAGDVLRILAGGEVKFEGRPEGNSGSPIFEIPTGPVTVEVEWTSGPQTGTPRTAALTGVEVRRPLPEGVASALDAPAGTTFFTTAPDLWDTGTATPNSGLAALARPLPLNPAAFPELSAWVEGPGVLTYQRRADLPAGSSLPFPGVPDIFNPGPFSWQPVTVPVPAGRHRLVWVSPTSGQGFFSPTARYALDGFNLQPGTGGSTISIAEALDTPGRAWVSSGDDVNAGNFAALALDGVDAVALEPVGEADPAWVETTVDGPAWVSVNSSRSSVATTLDGEFPQLGITETPATDPLWLCTRFLVPAGPHILRLAGSDPRHPTLLDRVEITPQPAIPVSDALDAPDLTFTIGGGRWQALQSPEAADGDALFASGAGTGWVGTEISGPARIRFNWRAGPEYTRLSLEMDGMEIVVSPPYQPWETVSVEIPAGTHSFRWVFTSPDNRRGTPAGLNHLTVSPLSGATLADALDAPGQTWLTRGPQPDWTAQGNLSHDGQDAAFVPSSEDESLNGGSELQTPVVGPALVRFWWRKDGAGKTLLQMDDRNVAQLNDENTWQEVTVTVPPGSHLLKWTRFKDNYFDLRSALLVDDFRIQPLPAGLTLGEALDAPDLPWRTPSTAPWELAWRNLPNGGQEPAVISSSTPGETTWIETEVEGPAVLSFLFLEDSFGLSQGSLVVDGETVLPLRGAAWPDDAIPVRWPLAAGPHTIRWQWNVANSSPLGSNALERLMIDRVEIATGRRAFESLFPENSGVTLTGSHPWTVQPAPGGGFHAESNPVAPGFQSGIQMVVPGNRELAFRTGWAGLRSNRLGGCFLSADGPWYAIHGQGGYVGDTLNSVWYLPPGDDHTLRWNASSAQGVIDALFLDQVTLDTPAFPISEAIGLPQKTFLSTGGGRWFAQTSARHGEGPAVSSTGSGSLITTFTGPGTVRWWWKSEGTPANAFARLIVWPSGSPGVSATRAGNFGWQQEQVILPWGQTFRLEWRASDTGDGRLLLDDVTFDESATDSYTAWAIGKLAGGERATMAADPDGDGQPNLMEFAFGSDPTSRRSAYTQDIRIESGLVHLRLTRPDYDTTGLNYDLEFSPDLLEWTRLVRIPGGPSLPDDPVTCPIPSEITGSKGFVRLKLTYSAD